MPELPEVETIVRMLQGRLCGLAIATVELHRPDILRPLGLDLASFLVGRSFKSVTRRGKKIILTLNDGNRFYVHLGMSGRLTVEAPAQAVPAHTHLVIRIAEFELRFRDPRRFGGIWWLGKDDPTDIGMGPEPLTLRAPQLARQLARTSRAIKGALLDQTLIAGIGNIYADEALFAAGINPLDQANALSSAQITRLNNAIKATLRNAIRHGGSTLRDYRNPSGGRGAFQNHHRVYGHENQPCRTCGTAISRIMLGGRSTHFCPKCQNGSKPAPRLRHAPGRSQRSAHK